MGGRQTSSRHSPLFDLPVDILGDIIDLLARDKATLASLALVNSDCRQLARSYQFAEVRLGFNERSVQLLYRLIDETCTGFGPQVSARRHVTHPLFIGPCIRKLTVKSELDSGLGKAWPAYAADGRFPEEVMVEANRNFLATFRDPLLHALAHAMPNIEAISWCLDGPPINDDCLFPHIRRLRIRHLRIDRLVIKDFRDHWRANLLCVAPSPAAAGRSLLPESSTSILAFHDVLAAPTKQHLAFPRNLLWRCKKTLQRLTLRHMDTWGDNTGGVVSVTQQGQQTFVLSHLQYLDLTHLNGQLDLYSWVTLFAPSLRHLALPYDCANPEFQEVLSQYTTGHMSHLETLVVPCLPRSSNSSSIPQAAAEAAAEAARAVATFILKHPHLRKLSVHHGTDALIDSYLVPRLASGRFDSLTSLSLGWEAPAMPHTHDTMNLSNDTLAAIGRITTLEQLHLRVGTFPGHLDSLSQWLIDHGLVRQNLGGLTRLQKLAFTGDTYASARILQGCEAGYYLIHRVTTQDRMNAWFIQGGIGSVNALDDKGVWELIHREKMIAEGRIYMAAFPKLEWLYCGQWPMQIHLQKKSVDRLGEERETCWTFLNRTFTMVTTMKMICR
ncbi:hypothetical protein B0T24DRAFT_690963 [Lasiosphaeria ovina]|uniref:F-box domain-containing protein n=1 Tax=Lasiosphaeria ovina TaxID=92902 RepID=A0AAE0JVZ3_9PEZI|nr:hypothetical protein B0T24DRAFT_690963 [Lasiosphaeria ovina]